MVIDLTHRLRPLVQIGLPGHLEELDRTIDALPLTREHEIVLGLSAMSTGSLLSRSLEEVAARADGS